MQTAQKSESESQFYSQGNRLSHILDQIGFRSGHGRISHLQSFLQKNEPELFKDINYTTVRAWFRETAPPMRKVEVIIDCLNQNYDFSHDLSLIKTWWKVGGRYPFESTYTQDVLSDDKLNYKILALIEKNTCDGFTRKSSDELSFVKEKAVTLAKDFSDPNKQKCPDEILELIIKDSLNKI